MSLPAETLQADPVLRLRGIAKSFAGIRVLGGIDLDLYPGEVHALMGENGAGKSTLMKIASGVHRADGGEIAVEGAGVTFADVRDAERARHRHHSPGAEPGAGPLHRREHFSGARADGAAESWSTSPRMRQEAARLLQRLGLRSCQMERKPVSCRIGEKQLVEIAQGAVDRGAGPDHGRADLRLVAGGMPSACSPSSAS